jgi:hypothetical protein
VDDIIIDIIKSFGVPGTIVGMVYILWKSNIITLINSSDIEQLLLSHEKRFLSKTVIYIGLIILTFIFILLIVSFFITLEDKIPGIAKYLFIVGKVAEILVYVISVCSLFFFFLKRVKWVYSIKQLLSRNNKISNAFIAVVYFVILLQFIFANIYNGKP